MEYFFNFEKIAYLKGERPEGCILCLLRDRHPGVHDTVVYRSGEWLVSINLYPYNPGHLIIFPSRHVTDIRALDASERESLQAVQDRALNVLDSLYTPAGYNIGFNMGLEAGASIAHLHMHIIPRYPHEMGIAELLAGKRVLVEDVNRTTERLAEAFSH